MIRQATEKDAEQIAPLIISIWHDMELPILTTEAETDIQKTFIDAMGIPGYRYSYDHLHVYEQDDQIAGVIAGYPGKIESTLENAWIEAAKKNNLNNQAPVFTEAETFSGEWYLDSIVTAPSFRGRGIGSKLLAALPAIASEAGETVIGLSCDKENPNARRLYERTGFKKTGETIISGHVYDHMQLSI